MHSESFWGHVEPVGHKLIYWFHLTLFLHSIQSAFDRGNISINFFPFFNIRLYFSLFFSLFFFPLLFYWPPYDRRCSKQLTTSFKIFLNNQLSKSLLLQSLAPWENYLYPDFSIFVVGASVLLWNEDCWQFWGTSRWQSPVSKGYQQVLFQMAHFMFFGFRIVMKQEGILYNEKDISIKYYWVADVQIINIKDYGYRNVKPFK